MALSPNYIRSSTRTFALIYVTPIQRPEFNIYLQATTRFLDVMDQRG